MLTLDLRSLSQSHSTANTSALSSTLSLTLYISYDGNGHTSNDGDGIRIIGSSHHHGPSTITNVSVVHQHATHMSKNTSVIYQPSSHTFGDGRLVIHVHSYDHHHAFHHESQDDEDVYDGHAYAYAYDAHSQVRDINIIVDFKNLEPVINTCICIPLPNYMYITLFI